MLKTRSSSLSRVHTLTQISCLAGIVWLHAGSSSCFAQEQDVVAAASAFTRAQQAELSGQHARAAELFELADRAAPTPEALRSATRARLTAGQTEAAAGNAEELLRRYPDDQTSRELAEKVLADARPQLMRLRLQCSEPCTVVVDGLAASVSAQQTQVVYLSPGSHQVILGFAQGLTRELHLRGAAGEERTDSVAKPEPAATQLASSSSASDPESATVAHLRPAVATRADDARVAHGLPPAYFWSAAALTVATGGVALWSGLDLLKARDDFARDATPTQAEFEAGERRDMRTSVLLGATGALLAGTAVLALFTDFGSRSEEAAALSLYPQGAKLTYRSRF